MGGGWMMMLREFASLSLLQAQTLGSPAHQSCWSKKEQNNETIKTEKCRDARCSIYNAKYIKKKRTNSVSFGLDNFKHKGWVRNGLQNLVTLVWGSRWLKRGGGRGSPFWRNGLGGNVPFQFLTDLLKLVSTNVYHVMHSFLFQEKACTIWRKYLKLNAMYLWVQNSNQYDKSKWIELKINIKVKVQQMGIIYLVGAVLPTDWRWPVGTNFDEQWIMNNYVERFQWG